MNYTVSNKLKTFSIILVILGLLGMGYGFMSTPESVEQVETMLANDAHHGGGHEVEDDATHHEMAADSHDTHPENAHAEADHGSSHAEHVFHRLHNRPWAAIYVAAFFFFMIALGALAFYAIQWAAQAGWSPVLFRVMEAISAYVLPGSVIVLAIAIASHYIGHNSLFIWMDPDVVAHDELIKGKSGFLNMPFFIGRGIFFIIGWAGYRYLVRKFSIAQDTSSDDSNFKKAFRFSAAFLVFYIVTESIMSWDWIMSVDPHWFSTLFGWYVFASMFVSGITVIALMTIYLAVQYFDF